MFAVAFLLLSPHHEYGQVRGQSKGTLGPETLVMVASMMVE